MIRLLSAERYKLVRSKSLYISVAVMTGVVFLMYAMMGMMDRIRKKEAATETDGAVIFAWEESVSDSGAEQGSVSSIWEEIGIMEMVRQIFSGDLIACVLAVFVSISVVGEFVSGMMKNVVGKGCRRWKIFLARLIVTEAASALIILTGIASAVLAGWLFAGSGYLAGLSLKNLAAFTGLQLLPAMALTAVYMLAGGLCRNYAAGISLGIGIAAFPMLIVTGLDRMFAQSAFTPSEYWLVSRSAGCPYEGFTAGYVAETLTVSLVWFALAAGAGIWHFSRADIR